jgi:hypothetical protein
MNNLFIEGCLQLDFSACGTAARFDDGRTNPYGMKAVDFVVESSDRLYFVEVKDFQNSLAPQEQRDNDYQLLIEAGTSKKKRTLLNPDEEEAVSVFNLEMGEKIKDSLLRWYAVDNEFTKKVTYLLFIRLDALDNPARRRLAEKISGHVPTGLNNQRFGKFTELTFDLVDVSGLQKYDIICTALSQQT